MAYGNEVAPDSRDQLDGDDFESFLDGLDGGK